MRLVPLMAGLEKAGDSSNAQPVAAGIAMEITCWPDMKIQGDAELVKVKEHPRLRLASPPARVSSETCAWVQKRPRP